MSIFSRQAQTEEYGGVIGYLMANECALEEVMEVLDNLRKLSASDLKVLYAFRRGGEIQTNYAVTELAGISPYLQHAPKTGGEVKRRIEQLFPSLMRLQGLGVIIVPPPNSGGMTSYSGPVPPDVGPLTGYLNQFATLTGSGLRLVQALPP